MKQKKSITDLEKEIKETQTAIEKQKKDLETASIKKIIDTKIITTRHWRVAQFLRESVQLEPSGKHPEWPELAQMLPDSSWWITFDICDGAKLHRFNDSIKLSLMADEVISLIKSLGLTIERGNIREQIEGAENGVKFEQNRIDVLTSIENVSTGKPYRTYTLKK